jgi:hypothetical protein
MPRTTGPSPHSLIAARSRAIRAGMMLAGPQMEDPGAVEEAAAPVLAWMMQYRDATDLHARTLAVEHHLAAMQRTFNHTGSVRTATATAFLKAALGYYAVLAGRSGPGAGEQCDPGTRGVIFTTGQLAAARAALAQFRPADPALARNRDSAAALLETLA